MTQYPHLRHRDESNRTTSRIAPNHLWLAHCQSRTANPQLQPFVLVSFSRAIAVCFRAAVQGTPDKKVPALNVSCRDTASEPRVRAHGGWNDRVYEPLTVCMIQKTEGAAPESVFRRRADPSGEIAMQCPCERDFVFLSISGVPVLLASSGTETRFPVASLQTGALRTVSASNCEQPRLNTQSVLQCLEQICALSLSSRSSVTFQCRSTFFFSLDTWRGHMCDYAVAP